jgi:ComEC/Rec2-related protein
LTNADLATFLPTDDEWITTRTGMKERRISHVPGIELAIVAAERAIACAGLTGADIDLIIYGSCSNDETVPNSASAVQQRIGATRAAAFDVNTACTSFMYGLSVGSSMVRTGVARNVVVIGVELISQYMDWDNRNVAVLFGVCGVCLEALRVPWWLRGWCLIMTGLLFLVVVDVEVSVLRAGVAGVMAGTSLTFGRGWRGNGVLATAAIGTLLVDPWSARNVGFQLSYGAVLALRYGSGPVDRCLATCWPKRWTLQDGWVLVWMRGLRLAFAASLAASLMSTPITLLSFGDGSREKIIVIVGVIIVVVVFAKTTFFCYLFVDFFMCLMLTFSIVVVMISISSSTLIIPLGIIIIIYFIILVFVFTFIIAIRD